MYQVLFAFKIKCDLIHIVGKCFKFRRNIANSFHFDPLPSRAFGVAHISEHCMWTTSRVMGCMSMRHKSIRGHWK